MRKRLFVLLVALALSFRGSQAKTCFSSSGTDVRYDGSCSGKTKLLSKTESVAVKFEPPNVDAKSEVTMKFGGCEVKTSLGSVGPSKTFYFGDVSYNLPITAKINTGAATFSNANNANFYKSSCSIKFTSTSGGYLLDVEVSVDPSVPTFKALFKSVSIYSSGASDSLNWWQIMSIVILCIVVIACIAAVIFYCFVLKLLCFKRKLEIKSEPPKKSRVIPPEVSIEVVDETEALKEDDAKKIDKPVTEWKDERPSEDKQPPKTSAEEVKAPELVEKKAKNEAKKPVQREKSVETEEQDRRPRVSFIQRIIEGTATGGDSQVSDFVGDEIDVTIEHETYLPPPNVKRRFLKSRAAKFLRILLPLKPHERRFILVFVEKTCVIVYDVCLKTLKLIEKDKSGIDTHELRKQVNVILKLAREVYLFLHEGYKKALVPWSYKTLDEIALLDYDAIDYGVAVFPLNSAQLAHVQATYEQKVARRDELFTADNSETKKLDHAIKMLLNLKIQVDHRSRANKKRKTFIKSLTREE